MDAVRSGSSLVSLAYSQTNLSFSYQTQSLSGQNTSGVEASRVDFSAEAKQLAAQFLSEGEGQDSTLASLLPTTTNEQSSDFALMAENDPGLQTLLRGVEALIGDDTDWLARFQKGIQDLYSALSGNGIASSPASSSAGQVDPSSAEAAQGLQIGRYASFSMEAHMAAVYAASSEGEVSIQQISIDIKIEAVSVEAQAETAMADPLVLDLNRDGVISASGPENGIFFDINGDGAREHTAFISGADGALALDRDGDGVIGSGSELFGDQNGALNGFLELAKYDDNQDGEISALDSVFKDLKVVTKNEDGTLTLKPLSEYDIQSLRLGARSGYAGLGSAGHLNAFSSYTTNGGQTGLAADAMLTYTV